MASRTGARRTSGQKKIKKYRKPLNINIGMIIFAVILVYVLACVVLYFQTGHIVRYEVKKGSLATNKIYRGVVLRDEVVVNNKSAGYVSYYANEGERVAANDLVYVVDQTGRLNEALANVGMDENTLSEKELLEFRNELINFSHGFEKKEFANVYETKNSLKNTVHKLANVNMLESVEQMSGSSGVVSRAHAPRTGVISYWVDGYENLTADQVTEEIFDKEAYEGKKVQLLSGTLLENNGAAYKLSTDENWSIVIPVEDAERGAELEAEGYIKVRFLKNQYESWGATKLLHNGDGKHYLELTFTNSMVTFVGDRFLEIELLLSDDTGLKIPNSAIVDKEFYLIPEEFVTPEGDSGKGQVLRQYVMENGEVSSKYYEISLYSYDEESAEYYVDASILDAENVLLKKDGQDTFTVSKRATLTGVYNVNNGYADFRQINILAQNEEYAIVKANTRYGLNVYDYIALNADTVHDDQFIND
ncbi:MAG: hypothetical protein E7292_07210 [Lachnospiraceae bacterium]|nr:hypothetical protein [Lachnospiraceae bacterium]